MGRAVALVRERPARLGAVRLVAVDGPSGSGKSTFAAELAAAAAKRVSGRVVHPRRAAPHGSGAGSSGRRNDGAGVAASGRSVAGGSVASRCAERTSHMGIPSTTVAVVSTDLLATWEEPLSWWALLEDGLLGPLAAGRAADLRVTGWVSGNPRPGGLLHVPVVDVLILEGVSAGRAAVADRLTALIWIEVPDPAERLERAVSRDGERMRPFLRRWQVDEASHFAADGTADRADLVIHPA